MIFKIIQEIKADPSKNAKIAILTKHKDNQLLKDVLVACYNPYTQYYLRKIPAYETWNPVISMPRGGYLSLADALEVIKALSSREVTGHAAKEMLAATLGDMSADDAQVLERIIKKSWIAA